MRFCVSTRRHPRGETPVTEFVGVKEKSLSQRTMIEEIRAQLAATAALLAARQPHHAQLFATRERIKMARNNLAIPAADRCQLCGHRRREATASACGPCQSVASLPLI